MRLEITMKSGSGWKILNESLMEEEGRLYKSVAIANFGKNKYLNDGFETVIVKAFTDFT